MTTRGYRAVNLPSSMVEEIRRVKDSLFFHSVDDFVRDAVRRRLEEIWDNENKKNRGI